MCEHKPLSARRCYAALASCARHALAGALLAALTIAGPAFAALTIDGVTFGGSASMAVTPGSTVPISVTVTNDNLNLWRSTAWRISTSAPGTVTCVDTPDHLVIGETASESFNATAPNTAGTYNAYIVASNNGTCTGSTTTATRNAAIFVASPTLAKTTSASAGVVGDVVTFRITAANPLSVPLNNVVVSDTLPTGMSYTAHAVTLGSATVAGQTITWSIPSIPANGNAQLTLAVALTQSGTLTNTATSAGATSASASILVLASAATHFRLDETAGSWTGAAGEVLDSGGTGLVGRRATTNSPTTTNVVSPSPTIDSQHGSVVGSFCNAGSFDGRAVVQVSSNPRLQYTTRLSATAWIYPTAYPSGGSDLYSILSNDQNYEFHINPSGKLFWWWNASSLTSATTIPRNQWTHVAITLDSSDGVRRQRIYINGVRDANTNNWRGTLATNNCDFYIGGDINTASGCPFNSARNFRGMIDEVKLYNYELSAAEVQADMTHGRLCSGTFDHIRIEHDGSASVCAPETVTIRACLDENCSSLYTGNVTVNLLPSGWMGAGGDTFSFNGGIATRQLSIGTAGDVTLGTNNVSPTPAAATRCFIGNGENCTMTFNAASCAFDAVEAAANPQTRIYTKLSGTAFSLDVLALRSNRTIDTAYTGNVAVDLVDASASTCPTGSGLNTATNVNFTSANRGRRAVSFNYPDAARNVRVRMRVGSSAPACSTDNFAIRPQQFAISSSMTNTGLTGTPKATAGSAFTLTAATTVGGGYNGTPAIDASKVDDHDGDAIASGTLSGSFSAGTGTSASGSAFRYRDVGSIRFNADAVVDSGFTAVDQTADCVEDSTSNTLSGGKYGCNVGSAASAKFGRWHPSHYSFSGSLAPGCAAGSFTYMGQDALVTALTVKAHANTSGTPSAADPVTSRYTSGSYPDANLASVTFAGDNGGTAVALTRLQSPAFPTMPSKALWSAGLFAIGDTFAFSRLAAPDGPYEAFKIVASLTDPDDSTLIGTSAQKQTNTTRLRYGRLRIGSAYGSELRDLPIPYEAQYWTSGGWITNRDDDCTTFNVSSLALSAFTQNLAACETQLSPTGAQTLANGRLALRLTAPGAGNPGSVTLTQNLGAAASGSTCVGAASSAATAADMPWFGGNPSARAVFGVFRSPYIYYRESF